MLPLVASQADLALVADSCFAYPSSVSGYRINVKLDSGLESSRDI